MKHLKFIGIMFGGFVLITSINLAVGAPLWAITVCNSIYGGWFGWNATEIWQRC